MATKKKTTVETDKPAKTVKAVKATAKTTAAKSAAPVKAVKEAKASKTAACNKALKEAAELLLWFSRLKTEPERTPLSRMRRKLRNS